MSHPIIIDGYEFERLETAPCYRLIALGIGIEPFCRCPSCNARGPESVKAAEIGRQKALALIYRQTHSDFKGRLPDGTRTVLVLRNGGTTLVALHALTDAEIANLAPSAKRQENRRLADKLARPAQ